MLLTCNTVEEARLKGSEQDWSQTWSSRALPRALHTPSALPKHPALSPQAAFTPILSYHSRYTEQVNLENDLQIQSHQEDEVVGKLRHQQPKGGHDPPGSNKTCPSAFLCTRKHPSFSGYNTVNMAGIPSWVGYSCIV